MSNNSWQRNLAGLWLGQMMMTIGFSFVFPFMPLYIQVLGVRGTAEVAQWAGIIVASSAVSMTVAQPIWGNLADRWGRKPMVIRSMMSAGIIVILMGFATSPEQLLVLRLVQGGLSGSLSASNALVATLTPKQRLGYALGLMQVAFFLGQSVGPLIGGLVADTFGFRASFYTSGTLMMLGAAIVITVVRENFKPAPADSPRQGMVAGSRSLLAITLFPVMLSVIFLIQLGGTIVNPIVSLFISDLNGAENAATMSGMVLAATGAISAASAVIIGRFSDRIGRTKVLLICLAGAGIAYSPQTLVQNVWQFLGLRMLLGVFLGGLMPTANALMAELIPTERRGAAFGLAASANSTANFLGPLSAAGIATHWGIRAIFMVTATLYFLALAWVSVSYRRMRKPAPAEGQATLAEASLSSQQNPSARY